jgi:hypothetical protein
LPEKNKLVAQRGDLLARLSELGGELIDESSALRKPLRCSSTYTSSTQASVYLTQIIDASFVGEV